MGLGGMKISKLRRIDSTGDWAFNVILPAPGGWIALNGVFYRPENRQIRFPYARGKNALKAIAAAGTTVSRLRELVEAELTKAEQ